MERKLIEALLGRELTDAEWLVACDLLGFLNRHPEAEAVFERCIDRRLSVEVTIAELSKLKTRAASNTNLHALRRRYRAAYNAFQAASARMDDDQASSALWDAAFNNLEDARLEILAALEGSDSKLKTKHPTARTSMPSANWNER
jgi:hypothetical protein